MVDRPATADALSKGIIDLRLERVTSDPLATDAIIKELGPAGLGARWTRISVDWASLQPQAPPAAYNEAYFARLDDIISTLYADGVRVIISPLRVPKWASDRSLWASPPPGYEKGYRVFYPPDRTHLVDLRRLGAELARRFAKYRVLYRCWNEPNIYLYLYPQTRRGSPDFGAASYLRMLKAFSLGVKGVQPRAIVIAGATSPYGKHDAIHTSPLRFARYLKAHGAARYFDAYAHHPYQSNGAAPNVRPTDPSTTVTLANLSQLLRVFPKKPFYLTEYGYSTRDCITGFSGVSDGLQARYMRQGYRIAARYRQVKVMLWFLIRDTAPYGDPSGFFFGLEKYDGSRKPSWSAFAHLK